MINYYPASGLIGGFDVSDGARRAPTSARENDRGRGADAARPRAPDMLIIDHARALIGAAVESLRESGFVEVRIYRIRIVRVTVDSTNRIE